MESFKIKIFIFLLLYCSILIQAQGENSIAKKFEKRSHTFESTTLPYRIFVPEDYDSTKSYPLLLCLHGAGERGIDNEIPIKKHSLAVSWANPEIQKKHPSIIVAPQCPKKKKWSYVDWGKGSYNMDTIPVGKEMLSVVDLLDTLLQEFNIDENRQYVTGLSMGGYATWDIIIRYPERFAAAVPMSGAGDPTKALLFKNLPLWIFHNTNDQIVPVSGSRDMVEAMENSGINVVKTLGLSEKKLNQQLQKKEIHLYTESPEGNHGPWEPWYNNSNLHDWVFLQSK